MTARGWMVLGLVVAATGWWYSPLSPRTPAVATAAHGFNLRCPLPPRADSGRPPLQSPLPPALSSFRLAAADLRPLAGFSVDARVLGRKDYAFGR